MKLTHCGRPEGQSVSETRRQSDGEAYNTTNATEAVDADFDGHGDKSAGLILGSL